MRVVSLVPSLTETLLSWRVDVVAGTRFCEQPGLAQVGGTKDPDIGAIVGLRPDLVVLDEEENRREDADALVGAGLRILATRVRAVEDVAPELGRLAAAVGAGNTGEPLTSLPPSGAPTRRVFVPIWRRPWMTIAGATYGSSLLASIGLHNVYGDDEAPYPVVDLAEAARRDPDLVLLPSEPYPFARRHVGDINATMPRAEVVLVDGRDLFWWGVRTPGAAVRLSAQLRGAAGSVSGGS